MLAAGGLAFTGIAPQSEAATAAAPVPTAVTAATCKEITPATLTGTAKVVGNDVKVSFEGSLADGPRETGSCVKIPIHQDLWPRLLGDYAVLDGEDVTVAQMHVANGMIPFIFDDAYLAAHQNVTFKGQFAFGGQLRYGPDYKAYSFTWDLPGEAQPVVINIPDCDWCQDKTIYSGKWAVVEQEGATVISAITLGTQISEGIFTHAAYVPNAVKAEDYTADVTISDTLGPGQKCAYAVLFDITSTEEELKRVDCESDTFVAVNIPNFKRGQLLRLEVTADITDFDRPSYTDIGTIEAKGVAKVHYPATAAWSTVSAEGDGDTPKPGGGSNSAPPVQTPSTPVDVPVTPTTPAPQPTPSTPSTPVTPGTPTTPGKPGTPSKPVTKPAVKPSYVTRTFQVDRYAPKTARAARAVAAFDDDGRLLHREDKPLWGASRWEFGTVRVPVRASDAVVMKAINAATKKTGDVRTTAKLGSMKAGASVVVAWELGRGATTTAPWGKGGTVAQIFFARS